MLMGPNVHNHSTPKTMSQPPISIENMWVVKESTQLKHHIFIMTTTFHRSSISNRDLEVVHSMDVTMGFLGYTSMNEVMGAITINYDNDFAIFVVSNQFEDLVS